MRIVVAEDNRLMRRGLVSMFATVDHVEVVAECGDLDGLRDAVAEHGPDVVVTDIRMPPDQDDEGIQAATWLADAHPEVGVLVLSQYVNPDYAVRLLAGGAGRRGYLLKDRVADGDELCRAIDEIAAEGSVVDPKVVEALVEASRASPASPVDQLTVREAEVLAEMARGHSNASIAATLGLSERAIEKHSSAIFTKLGLSEERDRNRRVSAVLIYLGAGNHTP